MVLITIGEKTIYADRIFGFPSLASGFVVNYVYEGASLGTPSPNKLL